MDFLKHQAPPAHHLSGSCGHYGQPECNTLWAAYCVFKDSSAWVNSLCPQDQFTTDIAAADIAVGCPSDPSLVTLYLKTQTKTDQLGKGAHIYISRSHNDLYPVAALMRYLAVQNTDPCLLFRNADGQQLSKSFIIERVRGALISGLDSNMGHSLHIRPATTATEVGIEGSTMGRWSSSAFLSYIRLLQHHLANLAVQLASL